MFRHNARLRTVRLVKLRRTMKVQIMNTETGEQETRELTNLKFDAQGNLREATIVGQAQLPSTSFIVLDEACNK